MFNVLGALNWSCPERNFGLGKLVALTKSPKQKEKIKHAQVQLHALANFTIKNWVMIVLSISQELFWVCIFSKISTICTWTLSLQWKWKLVKVNETYESFVFIQKTSKNDSKTCVISFRVTKTMFTVLVASLPPKPLFKAIFRLF